MQGCEVGREKRSGNETVALQFLELFPGQSNVQFQCSRFCFNIETQGILAVVNGNIKRNGRTYCRIMNYDHHIRIPRHFIQDSREIVQFHFK